MWWTGGDLRKILGYIDLFSFSFSSRALERTYSKNPFLKLMEYGSPYKLNELFNAYEKLWIKDSTPSSQFHVITKFFYEISKANMNCIIAFDFNILAEIVIQPKTSCNAKNRRLPATIP